jgi:uncharacterized protein YuzE
MKITITINTENAAFEYNTEAEVATILRQIVEKIAKGEDVDGEKTIDSNGNVVGQVSIEW